jgi:hypothetical protein
MYGSPAKTGCDRDSGPTEIVVVLYHREDETREMFEQLSKVTDNYSLIIVDNGFDDPDLIRGLEPLHYIENKENTGAIRGINQGLEQARGEYVAVLHSDVLIYDEGWLDHIIEFMGARPDVGLVGLGGWHEISADGLVSREVGDVDTKGWRPDKPVSRFTEVAAARGAGLVLRRTDLRFDDRFDTGSGCSIDLSLGYCELGYRIYAVSVDCSLKTADPHALAIARDALLEKRGEIVGVSCDYTDERSVAAETGELIGAMETVCCNIESRNERYEELLAINDSRQAELDRISILVRNLEREDREAHEVIERKADQVRELQARLGSTSTALIEPLYEGVCDGEHVDPCINGVSKLRLLLRTEGVAATARKSISFAWRKARNTSGPQANSKRREEE